MVAATATSEEEEQARQDNNNNSSKKQGRQKRIRKRGRGLALATEGTAQRVGRMGGSSPHKLRGLQAASEARKAPKFHHFLLLHAFSHAHIKAS